MRKSNCEFRQKEDYYLVKKAIFSILSAAPLLLTSTAYATSVSLSSNSTVASFSPTASVSGTLEADTGTQAFTGVNKLGQAVFSGTVDSQVYLDSKTGGLDFLYQINNANTYEDAINRVTMTNFTGFSTAVNYVTSSGSVSPFLADRSPAGDTVGFSFYTPNTIVPNSSTYWLEIDTNATTYGLGTTNLEDGGIATVTTYSPAPEPVSMGLLGFGFTALGLLRFRSRRKA
jgi:hypothetical protein